MQLLPLNVVKNNIEQWISKGSLDKKDLDANLAKMPWTRGTYNHKGQQRSVLLNKPVDKGVDSTSNGRYDYIR